MIEAGFPATVSDYTNHCDLIGLVNDADDVLTTKYHMGIVAGALEKRVCAIPWNHYKVQRFYTEVGSAGSCQALEKADESSVENLLEKAFLDSAPIKIPQDMQERSFNNRELVKQWLASVQ